MKGSRVKKNVYLDRIRPCPVCGKMPKVYRDYGYEANGYGAWCTIECKPFLRKAHFKIESGKDRWKRAFMDAIDRWNEMVGVKWTWKQ